MTRIGSKTKTWINLESNSFATFILTAHKGAMPYDIIHGFDDFYICVKIDTPILI